jgi:predicted nucleic acid-binding protein
VREPVAPARVLVDSGPLLALFNARDAWHSRILGWLREHRSTRLVSTWCVATEVCALLSHRIGNAAALDFLRWIERGALELDVPVPTSLVAVLESRTC